VIAITGHRGDVGSYLLKMYGENEVFGYDGDLRSASRILHLAAKSSPASSSEIIESNIIFLKRLIEKAENENIKELIFFSAASVYGNGNHGDVTEETAFDSPNIYGLSKALGEELLKDSKLNVIVLRLPAILAPANTTNIISRWHKMLLNNEDVTLKNSSKLFNNFISIESIFDFIREFEFKKKFDVVNLAAKKEMTIKEIVHMMARELESKSLITDGGDSPFFSIDTTKAKINYGFSPESSQKAILSWLQKRSLL